MAGEVKKVEYITGSDGVRYKVELTPESKSSAEHVRTRTHSSKKLGVIISCIAVALLLIIAGLFWQKQSQRTPISSYKKQLSFPLYYPSELPVGYKIVTSSINSSDGVLLFAIKNNGTEITISEQSMPDQLQSFKVDGFNTVATPVGAMLIGSTSDSPSAIITTEKTLITIKGDKQAGRELVTTLGQKLRKL